MRLLYFDTWLQSPPPVSFPGCLSVQVISACTPGGQAHWMARVSKGFLFRNLWFHRRKVFKRALRYAQAIGLRRTLAKVRSNILAFQDELLNTTAAVSGVVIDGEIRESFPSGSIVAGYRQNHPLYADILLLHPDQAAEVPPGIAAEDAATVFYYAQAWEACKRIQSHRFKGKPVVICGDSLPIWLLQRFLSEAQQETTTYIAEPNKHSAAEVETWARKGSCVVIGNEQWIHWLAGRVRPDQSLYLHRAEYWNPREWKALQPNWIGLPHESLYQLNLFSQLHLDLPAYLCREGLREALKEMSRRSWKPSSFLKSYRWCEAQSRVDLRFAYSFKRDTLEPERTANPRCRSPLFSGKRPLLRVGFIGLGMWARGNLIPFLLRDWRVHLVMGADQDPVRLQQAGELFRIPILCTDPPELCSSKEVDAVFISTWHDSHASIASMALKAGKKVFVEKPLALDSGQLKLVASALEGARQPFLAVGYNRIHSSLTHLLRGEMAATEGPVSLTALVREPTIPPTHYYYWPRQGSRILGNACHWIDYAFYLLLPRMPADLQVIPSLSEEGRDQKILIMRYADGSLVSLVFSSVGESLIGGEEYIDIKFADTQYRIQDFKSCLRYKDGKWKKIWRSPTDRGWQQEMRDVVDGMISGLPPRSYREIITSANLVLEARVSYEKRGEVRSLCSGLNFPFR